MKIITAPDALTFEGRTIFLAGSIEQDTAEQWQQRLVDRFRNFEVTFFNPRREAWDSSWKQSIESPPFREQVMWELTALDAADVIVMYFDPNTKSPISLLELGLYAASGKMLVCCPEGFWRKGNVDIVCQKYSIPLFGTLDELIAFLNYKLTA